jgi:hypothetical protein
VSVRVRVSCDRHLPPVRVGVRVRVRDKDKTGREEQKKQRYHDLERFGDSLTFITNS